jgi:hypothetical protein
MVMHLSGRLIRQHIYSQLQSLVCLYRVRIAAMRSSAEERQMLIDMAEHASKLKDSLAPKWELVDELKFPSIPLGFLTLVGFIQVQQLSPNISTLIAGALLMPYVLACRVEYLRGRNCRKKDLQDARLEQASRRARPKQ